MTLLTSPLRTERKVGFKDHKEDFLDVSFTPPSPPSSSSSSRLIFTFGKGKGLGAMRDLTSSRVLDVRV